MNNKHERHQRREENERERERESFDLFIDIR